MQKFTRLCSRAGEVSPGSLCGRDHAANFLQPFRASETLCQHTVLHGERHAWARAAEVTKAEHILFVAEVSRRVDNTSPCSLRLAAKKKRACAARDLLLLPVPVSLGIALLSAGRVFGRPWPRPGSCGRHARCDSISAHPPPRSLATNESPDAARARRAAGFGSVAPFEAGASMRVDTND